MLLSGRQASARRGMVTSPHTLASEAGLRVLEDGGNAIEAAIAMGAVLAVTYPHFCGLGGDAVWLVADREVRRDCFLGIGQAAAVPGAFDGPIPVRGPRSAVTSACLVDSWGHALDYAHRHWQGRRSFASLLADAIRLARDGFAVTPSQAFWLGMRAGETADWPGFSAVFDVPAGSNFRQPALARTLETLAAEGPRSFYEGRLGARIAGGLAAAGSPLTNEDLRRTRTRQVEPLSLDYGGTTLLAPPPPTQGVSTLAIMGILARIGGDGVEEGSADHYHRLVEAVKQAFLERDRIADPDHGAQQVEDWLSPTTLAAKAARIDPHWAMPWPPVFRTGDTVFLAATDAEGRSVSLLQSLYFDWGSGVAAGDTGILWQNRGAAFSTVSGHPNVIAPGKRPFYTLNPGIALQDGRPSLLYGTQGADGQPQTLAAILSRVLDHGLAPAEALARPRFLLGRTFSDSRDSLKLEADVGDAVVAELRGRGHELATIPAQSPLAGQAGLIRIAADGTITGAHDPRSDGVALGL
jgi:gamma-glutamyltranspeptidase